MSVIDETIFREIHERRQSDSSPTDLMGMLLAASYPDGGRLTDAQVRDELLPLTTTGYETTGEGLAWMLFLLSGQRTVEDKLLAEVAAVVGAGRLRPEHFSQLRFAEMVVAETLRLYPPTWTYVRVPIEDDHLPSGVTVKKGELLFLCQFLMHRHPEYFPEPETFRPERFASDSDRRSWQFVYFPFGVGSHRCIGEHLALLELVFALVMMVRKFRFELVEPNSVRPVAGLTLAPRSEIRALLQQR